LFVPKPTNPKVQQFLETQGLVGFGTNKLKHIGQSPPLLIHLLGARVSQYSRHQQRLAIFHHYF
jgi:hypothetical protein